MTLEKLNEIIDGAMQEIAHGMIVNASGMKGNQLEKQLAADFDLLVELDETARKVAAKKFPETPS